MKRLIILLLLVGLFVENSESQYEGECQFSQSLKPRPHSVSVLEFGAVGDGKTVNTVAFQNAIFYLNSFADKGGAQLYVPAGKWLTGTINLTSHLTLFLEKDAVILGSQVIMLDNSHFKLYLLQGALCGSLRFKFTNIIPLLSLVFNVVVDLFDLMMWN